MTLLKNLSITFSLCFLIGCAHEVEIAEAEITIYPNPFETEFHLNVNAKAKIELKVIIYSKQLAMAQTAPIFTPLERNPVIEETIDIGSSDYRFDLSNWDDGNYFMDVVINGKARKFNLLKDSD